MKKNILFFLIPLALLPISSFGTVIIDTPSLTSTGNPTEDNSIVKEIDKQNTKELADFKLQTFKSCEDMNSVLDKYITEYWKNNKNRYQRREILYNVDKMELKTTSASVEQSIVAPTSAGTSNKKTDFSKTNTQVGGVDESDIIKTDGSNIYYYNQSENKVYISNIRDKKIIKIIQVPSQFENPTLYIDDATLSIVASGYRNNTQKTYVALYAISQKNTFSFQKLYSVDGGLSHSRKIGNKLYLISNSHINIPFYDWKNEEDIQFDIRKYIPKKLEAIRTKNKKKPYNISQTSTAHCDSIEYSLPDAETLKKFDFNPGFMIISVIDVKDIFSPVKTKVIAGSNTEIHMSLENLYLTEHMYSSSPYSCPRGMMCIASQYGQGTNTVVHKMNLSNGDVRYQTSNIVPGRPLTQYSMDEHDSYFRILTQTENWSTKSTRKYTGLYILDKDLKLSGKLENLGNNENFKSSRYMGDKLFLVTFKDIDPFFVIDVANPKDPKVLGELKIPGYSTYLHPYDNKHIIGLGYNTSDNGHGGVYNDGLKLDLYEINYDKKCGMKNISSEDEKKCEKGDYKGIIARQKQSYTFGGYGSESEALHNPRMFMWDTAKNTLFLPVTLIFNNKDNKYRATDFFDGMMAISITPEAIKKQYKISHIDMSDVHEKRIKSCEPYLKNTETKKCVKLLNGKEYCESENQRRVPEYCFADAKDGAYIAHDRWNYRDQFVKRALWVGDQIFVFSDTMMTAHNKENGAFEFGQYFDPIKSITAKIFATFNQDK